MKRIFTTFVCAFAVCAAADAQQRSGAPASCPQADTVLLSADVDGTYLVRKYLVKQHADRNSDYAVRYQVDVAQLSSTLAGNARQLDDLQAFIDKVSQDKSLRVTGVTITGYASPDGPEKFNDKLASARSETGRKAVEKILAEYGFNIDAAGYGEDWEGFKEMVEKSNIQDKDLILQVLSMYDSSAERENQIKNMSSVYGELKEDVLPKLRRAQLVNNMEITGKSDAEMLALVNSGKLDELNNEELLHVATLIEDNAVKAKVLEYAAKKYDDSRAYTNLGAAYLQMGDADKALAALTQAVKLGGNTQELNSNLALANLAAGNVDEAKKYAAAADAQTKSLIAAAQGQYGDAAAKLKGYNAAVAAVMNNDLSAAKKALAGENSADADYLRAVIATKEGDMKTAGAQLKAAVAKDSALAKKASKDVNLKPLFKSGFKF